MNLQSHAQDMRAEVCNASKAGVEGVCTFALGGILSLLVAALLPLSPHDVNVWRSATSLRAASVFHLRCRAFEDCDH